MIIVGIKNGLGNQMFQYAFGKILEWRYKVSIQFDIMAEDFISGMRTDMEIFKIEDFQVADKKMVNGFKPFSVAKYKIEKKYLAYAYFKLRRIFQSKKLVTERLPSQFIPIINHLDLSQDYYFMGHWMNLRYYEGYEDRIKTLFALKDISFYSTEIAMEIATSPYTTISLHIRRGDYLTADFIEVVGMYYYRQALAIMLENVENPFLYIFTNDEKWVSTKFDPMLPYKIVNINFGADSYKDMMLMSLCHHNIIANSSFSWWGAWLNRHPDKIVIAPRKWYSDTQRNRYVAEMVPKEWIRL